MALTQAEKDTFARIEEAFGDGHVALMQCTDAATGATVPVLCVGGWTGSEYAFLPVARIYTGDSALDAFVPPAGTLEHTGHA